MKKVKKIRKEPQLFKVQEMAVNTLHSIYLKFSDFPLAFREKVCEECKYSQPTFYRIMKKEDVLSNAEREKIISVMDECIQGLKEFAAMFREKPGEAA